MENKMMFVGPFKRYYPENRADRWAGGMWYCTPDGRDWHDLQREFQSNTLKVLLNEKRVVVSKTDDVSGFSPVGFWVAEVPADEVPDGADISGGWQYRNGRIVPREYTPDELKSEARYQRERLLKDATRVMGPLQDAVDLDMATDAEKAALLAWKKYRVLLNRVDISAAPDIDWPEPPESGGQ